MKKFVVIGIALACSPTMSLSHESAKVFASGTEGNKVCRIPAIVSLPDGSLLGFCEGRVNNAGILAISTSYRSEAMMAEKPGFFTNGSRLRYRTGRQSGTCG